jgi:hypothetical protein
MTLKRLAIAAVLLCCSTAAPALAQGVTLRFHEGLVTLTARNAPLRTILAEWARLGGATIVNGDRVAGGPLTLDLNAVPERQALDILLRSVSGYMAAPRVAGASGAAVYDRILILPTSTAPRPSTPQPGAQPQRPIQPPQQVAPPPIVEEEPFDDGVPDNPPPQPRGIPGRPSFPVPSPNGVPGNDQSDDDEPVPPPLMPGGPFGMPPGASSRPGVIVPVPPQPPQRRSPEPEP